MGIWTEFGAAASVDWCEPNYVLTTWIAEWWNTLSSLLIVALGVHGWLRCRRERAEPRFLFCFMTMAVVGAGSAAFHATMLQVAQALDELPMIYGGLGLLYCLVNGRLESPQRERRWTVGLVIYALLFTVCYFSMRSYFTLFIISYALIITAIVLGAAKLSFSSAGSPTHRRLFSLGAGSFCAGVFLFWFPEHVFFACDHPVQALHLHAWWHVLAAIGTYAGIRFAVYDRQAVRQTAPPAAQPANG